MKLDAELLSEVRRLEAEVEFLKGRVKDKDEVLGACRVALKAREDERAERTAAAALARENRRLGEEADRLRESGKGRSGEAGAPG